MAGESPDRSKQRESSAEPTSGSAGPVPEARKEDSPTREPRDPRLAVARDAEKSTARGGVDTATRVLSVPTTDGDTDGTPTDETPDAERAGDAEGDERESPAEQAERGEDDTATDGDADADAEQNEGEAGPVADDEDGESGAGTAAGEARRGSSGAPGAPAGSASAESAESSESGDSGASSASGERDAAPAAGDRRLRDAVTAWVATADRDRDEQDPATAEDRDGRDKQPGSADEDTQGGRTAEDPEEPAAGGPDDEETETATSGQPEADKAAKGAEAPADRDKADDTDEAETHAPGQPEADKSAKVADEAEVEADRSGASGRTGVDEDGSETGDGTPESGAAEADSAKSGSEDARDSDTDTGTGKDDDTDGDSPAAPPVDQPTAVFKAVRPPVDQPTTMLKLGDATKGGKDDEDGKAGKDTPRAPEKDSERTSKFVALKPLDDPSTRKPPPAAPAEQTAPADATASIPAVGPERTTQQPLPPRPPLDLLAELTNTPPPPDTPLRTAVRRVKIWTPLVLLLVVLLGVVQSVRPLPTPTLELTAEDSYTFEGGKVDIPWPAKGQAALDVQGIGTFGSSGEQKPVPIASVAKVMTAYVILRDHPLKSGEDGPKIEIDQAAEDQSDAGQESTVDVTKGDKISEREAVESILIASANNVARLLARWDAGSEKSFVRKMNDAAKDLGMKNTEYTDPSGLNNTTVSTAVDQVKLAKAAMQQQPVFREVATMMSYVDYKGRKHDNWNRLVGYNDVTGIKTGTTTSALGNLVFSARKDVDGETRRIVGAVVRQPAGGPDNTILGAALHEGDKLIRAAQGALKSATILKKGDVVGYADDGLGGRTPVVVTEDVTAVGWAGLSVKLTFAPDDMPHEAEAGTKVGTLTVGDGTSSAVKVPVALQKDLVEPGFTDKLTRLG
ncbi:D-alanyl-D-alanine carboxypeptidase [Streptomyces sp. NPDC019990]|uniref:D-alanyl-D-alanine carboxypeptidase n=1 Tax=Streptomyces sp. NPDC019990 TaxID=3154693 RepID=UPI0033F603D0